MKFWPEKKKQLQKITLLLILLFFLALVLGGVVFSRFKDLAQSPPCATVSSFHLETEGPSCSQRVDEAGFQIKDGRIRVFPRCLTIMNSRFGSRFNLDWYFGTQKVASGVLGSLEDRESYLFLGLEDEGGIEPIWPSLTNSSFSRQSVDLGLTYQQVNFESDQFLVSLIIKSPFAPSQSFDDENTKISAAPYFDLELVLTNKTSVEQTKTVVFSLNQADEIKKEKEQEVIYFNDGVRGDGIRALTAYENQAGLTPFIKNDQGGYRWQVAVPPKASKKVSLIYAGFVKGPVITDNSQDKRRGLHFAYHRWFKNLDEVLEFALTHRQQVEIKREEFEANLDRFGSNPQVKWLAAQAFHSYLGNTWLVYDKEKPDSQEYYVWEGHFKYLNTLDVAHDYGVLEGLYFPWVLKLELDSWQKFAKQDELGTVIPHDLGKQFRLNGSQAYGIPGSKSSGMPVEENANFLLLTYWYWRQTGDDQFVKELAPIMEELADSLIARDTNQNGLADKLVRMTTYDNDGNSALKEAPESTYLGIKQMAAYLATGEIFKTLGKDDAYEKVYRQAALISQSLKRAFEDYGFIPLSLDPEFREKNQFNSKTILGIQEQGFAFITGLFYPTLTDLKSPLVEELKPFLADSYQQAYEKSLVKDGDGLGFGLQLAENQALGLGWFSHSVMADYIAGQWFGQNYDSTKFYFPKLYDNPLSFADGQYFREPFYPPQTTLGFYPRGAALFSFLKK